MSVSPPLADGPRTPQNGERPPPPVTGLFGTDLQLSTDVRARPRTRGVRVIFADEEPEPGTKAAGGHSSSSTKADGRVLKLKPRKYQHALYEAAKDYNIIACLDTGAGKTLVAVMLLQHFNDIEIAKTVQPVPESASRFGQPGSPMRRIGLFLVTKVPLVDQQSQAIADNSNLQVQRISGSDLHASGSKEEWDRIRRHRDVVVVTAQVVLTALMHGYLGMQDIYAIILDEAHNAFGDAPYAGIMRHYDDFCKKAATETGLLPPRIFGMTASPLKKLGTDEAKTSERLESILKSHILTAPVMHRAELALAVNKPIECIVEYDRPSYFADSVLTQSIRQRLKDAEDLKPVFDRIHYHTIHHGPLFADIVWSTSLQEIKKQTAAQTAISMINEDWLMEKANAAPSRRGRLTTNSAGARMINDEVRRTFELPRVLNLTIEQVTPKILKLIDILSCFAATAQSRQNLRGIIFVERRDTAFALHELISRQKRLSWIKSAWLIGHGDGNDSVGLQQNHQDQAAVLSRFRSGQFNILVATSVIEEGLDVSPCNLIIRFDLFANHVSFVQSKGRARHKRSRFIMMAENGSEEHYRLIKEVADTDRALRQWLTDLPDDRIHDVNFAGDREDPDGDLILEVPDSGAKLYVQQATQLLADVYASLKGVDDEHATPQYEIEQLPKLEGFRCTIRMPPDWKMPDVVSEPRMSKKAAKRLAAFRVCEALYKAGTLSSTLRPKFNSVRRRKAGMAPLPAARLEEGVRVKTFQLQSFRGINLGYDEAAKGFKLHATLLSFEELPPTALNGPCRPMIVVTTDPVPRSGPFRMRFTSIDHVYPGFSASVPVVIDPEMMAYFKKYTLRMLKWIGRKGQWECPNDNLPYLTLPGTMNADKARVFDFQKHVDKEEILRLAAGPTTKVLECGMDVSIGNFWDRVLLERQYEIGAVAYAVTGVTRCKEEYLQLERQRYERRQQSAHSRNIWDDIPNVPPEALDMDWFTVARIERVQNFLTGLIDDRSADPKHYHAVALPPTNVWVHSISASAYRSAIMLPSMLDRIHQLMCAERCNLELFEGQIATSHLVEALTIPSVGYSYNYERLEFIGDTFLKFLATAYVFSEHITSQEGELHKERRDIIMNRTLLKHCVRLSLSDFLLLASFGPRTWTPPNFINPNGGRSTTRPVQGPRFEGYLPTSVHETPSVDQKALADLVESTMGAGLMTAGLEGAMHAARCLGITPRPIYSLKEVTAMYHEKTREDVAQKKLDKALKTEALLELETFLGYKFKSPHIALQATTHQPLLGYFASYERLEFLGDAVLDYFAVTDVYGRYPDFDQGELTEYKDILCQNRTLGALAEATQMHRFLFSTTSMVQSSITDANARLKMRRLEEERKPASQRGVYWRDVTVPKTVADAVALDSGFDMDALQALYNKIFKPFYDQYCRPTAEVDDDVRRFEHLIKNEQGCRQWSYQHDYTYQREEKVYTTSIYAHGVEWVRSRPCKNTQTAWT
ncbi:Dicer-like protein 1 [Tilletia horrida]|nr:Dicer-like protein 1 [Tilletia horrida]